MILKRLIAISVVLALAAGAVFAEISVSGQVIGTVNILESDSQKTLKTDDNGNTYLEGHPLSASASMNRLRLEAAGETDDGKFGAWLRAEGSDAALFGNAWWKPIDQLLIRIGGNGGDGFFGKDGNTRWMFYQKTSDTGIVNPGNAWGGGYGSVVFGDAFFGGNGGNAFRATISPLEVVDINIEVPFFDGDVPPNSPEQGVAASIYQRTLAQVDLKFGFGNIALTYAGNHNDWGGKPVDTFGIGVPLPVKIRTDENDDVVVNDNKTTDTADDLYYVDGHLGGGSGSKFYLYAGLSPIDSLSIDIGVGLTLPVKQKEETDDDGYTVSPEMKYLPPVAAGLGVKFTAGSFGVKARVVASFAGNVKTGTITSNGAKTEIDKITEPLRLTFDVLPFFAVNDNLRIFFSAGLGLTGKVDKELKATVKPDTGDETVYKFVYKSDSVVGWHINPYVEVGQEWGPRFLAGVRIWSTGEKYPISIDKGYEGFDIDGGYGYKKKINWAIPIALDVSF